LPLCTRLEYSRKKPSRALQLSHYEKVLQNKAFVCDDGVTIFVAGQKDRD